MILFYNIGFHEVHLVIKILQSQLRFLYSTILSNAVTLMWWLFRNHYRARWGSRFLLSEIPWRPSSLWVFHLEMDFRPWVRPYVLLSTVSLTVGSPGSISHGLHVYNTDTPGQGSKKVWLVLSENLLPFIAANVWRSFYSTKEWIFELYLQMVFFKLSRVHQQAGICGNSAQGINSGFGCHFDGIWIRGIVKVFNVLAMKLSVEMLSVTRGWECLRECFCRSKVMEFCYPIYEATLYHLLMKPLKY